MHGIIRFLVVVSLPFFVTNILEAQNCTAAFTVSETNLTIQFTDQSTASPGDPIVAWLWDFDDNGATSTQQNPVHTFSSPDRYDVVLEVTTANGCTAEVEIDIETCVLPLNVMVGSCTPDGTIPLTIAVTDTYGNADDINIAIDGNLLPGSPFEIDDDEPVNTTAFIMGDGLSHVLTVQSTDIGTCNNTFTFDAPDCNSNCFLSAMQVGFSGGATQVVNVGTGGNNIFTPNQTTITIGEVVEFNFVDDGHTTTSDATSGVDAWNSGELGVGSVYPVTIQNPGVHPYYCLPHGGPGGAGMSGTIIANCPAGNNFTIAINFTTTQANPAGFNVVVDGITQAGSPFSYNGTGPQTVTLPLSGDGQPHTIEVVDVNDPTCVLSTDFTAPDCGAAPACSLTTQATQTGGCNAANNVNVEVTLTSINGGAAGFTLTVDGASVPGSPFAYDASGTTVLNIEVTGDGQSHTIVATDINDISCTTSTAITTSNCSVLCALTDLAAATGGGGNTQVVLVEDFVFNPAQITIADGDVVEWQWVGAIDHTTTSDATSGADAWDSGLLGTGATFTSPVLSAGVHPYYCIPHGASGGVGMAGTITVQPNCTNGEVAANITFNESGGGFGGYQILVDGQVTPNSPIAYDPAGTNTATIFVLGDGQNHTIEVQDIDNPACSATTTLNTPDCNASTCQLTVSAVENGGCAADDTVPVEVTVDDVGGGSGFSVSVDGQNAGSFTYSGSGATVVSIDVVGDGNAHTIEVVDNDDPSCSATTSITTQNCQAQCVLSALTASTGSTSTHIVEVRDFDFLPQNLTINEGDVVDFQWTGAIDHTTTSDATTGEDVWNSGLLGTGASFQVADLSLGNHPYYCIPHGGPGGVGMAGEISVVPDCENGQVAVTLSFVEMDGGLNGFNVYVDGVSNANSPFNYSDNGINEVTIFAIGDGQLHRFEVQDANDVDCSNFIDFQTPDCSFTPPCELSLSVAQTSDCDAADEVEIQLTIENANAGTNFNLTIDGNNYPQNPVNYDPSGNTVLTLLLDGDGQSHLFEIMDNDSINCTASANLMVEDCTTPCHFSNLSLQIAGGGNAATHIVQVADFDFAPKDITVNIGDTVRFVWVGVIPHTVTSDATTGDDVFNSGLLQEGAIYDVVITTAGFHPYYCIPHGAPGGIGMAGTITAVENCDDGNLQMQFSFNVENGSFSGYEVYLNGNLERSPDYSSSNPQVFDLTLPAAGQMVHLMIQDVDDHSCLIDTTFQMPNCDDPCFGFVAAFANEINQQNLTVDFESLMNGATSWLWTFGNGDTSALENPTYTYPEKGTYEVCLIVQDTDLGCEDQICEQVTVGQLRCEAAFTYAIDGLTVSITDQSVTTEAIDQWIYNMGNLNWIVGQQHPVFTYDTLGIYTACLSIEAENCEADTCLTIDLSDACLAFQPAFDFVVDNEDLTIQFVDQTTGSPNQWLWGFGEANTSNEQNPAHTYDQMGVYNVCLLVQDTDLGCNKSICQTIQVGTVSTVDLEIRNFALKIYPNPTRKEHSTWTLEGILERDFFKKLEWKIYDVQGRTLVQQSVLGAKQVGVSAEHRLAPGIYFMELRSEHGFYRGKVVVQ